VSGAEAIWFLSIIFCGTGHLRHLNPLKLLGGLSLSPHYLFSNLKYVELFNDCFRFNHEIYFMQHVKI